MIIKLKIAILAFAVKSRIVRIISGYRIGIYNSGILNPGSSLYYSRLRLNNGSGSGGSSLRIKTVAAFHAEIRIVSNLSSALGTILTHFIYTSYSILMLNNYKAFTIMRSI
jgi:hypothetical protein